MVHSIHHSTAWRSRPMEYVRCDNERIMLRRHHHACWALGGAATCVWGAEGMLLVRKHGRRDTKGIIYRRVHGHRHTMRSKAIMRESTQRRMKDRGHQSTGCCVRESWVDGCDKGRGKRRTRCSRGRRLRTRLLRAIAFFRGRLRLCLCPISFSGRSGGTIRHRRSLSGNRQSLVISTRLLCPTITSGDVVTVVITLHVPSACFTITIVDLLVLGANRV